MPEPDPFGHEVGRWVRIIAYLEDEVCDRAHRQTARVDEITSKYRGDHGLASQENTDRAFFSAHAIVWSLWHVSDLLRAAGGSIETIDSGRAGSFRTAYESSSLKDLRNVLEHAAAYTAGKGRKPNLVTNDTPRIGFTTNIFPPWRVLSISAFGNEYRVREVVDLAYQLDPSTLTRVEASAS